MRFVLVAFTLALSSSALAQVNFDQLSPSTSPSVRRSANAALQTLPDRERVWIFGGFGGSFLAETWSFDTSTQQWTKAPTASDPGARDQHALAFDDALGKVVLFGGFHIAFPSLKHLNDLWMFDPATSTWTQLTESTTKPSARGFSSFVYVPTQDAFYLFGGYDITPSGTSTTGSFFGDVWKLTISGTTGTWTQVTTTGTAPTARAATCHAYDSARHKLFFYGGQTGIDASQTSVMNGETWELDVDTHAWTQVSATVPASLHPRGFCATTYDSDASKVLLYGGQEGDTLVDGAFSYDPATQTWTSEPLVDVNRGPVDDPSTAYSATLGKVLMFGGRIVAGGSSVYSNDTWLLHLEDHQPVANAGSDQTVNEQSTVALDGSASSDADGTALTFAWTQTSGTAVTFTNANAALATFTAPSTTSNIALTFHLTVSDGFYTAGDDVTINVKPALNHAPVANAGPDQVAVENGIVTLNASASSDPDGNALAFHWTQLAGPAVVLDDPTSIAPRFTAPPAGALLTFMVTVDDGSLSSTDTIDVTTTTAQNQPPVANAGPDVDTAPGVVATLDGSASSDPNGTALQFQWTQTQGPAVVLDDDTAAVAHFTAPVELTDTPIAFTLTVTDGVFFASDDVVVTVRPALGAPKIASVARTIGIVGQPYSYDGDDSVASTGTGVTFALLDAPLGMSIDSQSGLITWAPDVNGPQAVTVEASNAQGTDEQTWVIEVYAPPLITSTPSTNLVISAPYHYDDDDTPTAIGDGDIRWSLVDGPSGFVVDVATGKMTWVPVIETSTTVTIRAESAFGHDDQQFTITRPPDTLPTIRHTANPFAALGRPYLYDVDNGVDVDHVQPGDVVVVIPSAQIPEGFLMTQPGNDVLWTPQHAGTETITLSLVSSLGLPLDTYTFDVDVVDLGGDNAVATAQAAPTTGPAPLSVTFDGSGSHGSKGAPLFLYRWDTGDGSHVVTTAPIGQEAPTSTAYTYAFPGSYTAALEVWDAYGVFARDKVTISVLDGSKEPPTARIQANVLEGKDQLTVSFACDCSDKDGHIAGIEWSYGDGSFASDAAPTHTYVAPGNYHVRVTAIDDDGLTGTDDVDVQVRSGDLSPPFAHIAATPSEGDQPMNVVLTADVGGGDGAIVDVKWKLPDGTQRSGQQVSAVFQTPGYFPVLLEATDSNNLTGRDVLTIAVRADGVRAPKIVSTPSTVARANQAWLYDADGRASAQGGRPIAWRLGKELGDKKIGAPRGMSIDFNTGALSWKPTNDQAGPQHVVIVAENSAGATLQEFDVDVVATDAPAGCSSTRASDGAPFALFAFLGVFVRRRRRRALHASLWAFVALCAFVATTAAHAAPVITSVPATTQARVGQLWTYETPSADGDGALAWALSNGPAGMVVDDVDGRVVWMPVSAGSFDVDLVVADRNGTSTQTFTVDVTAGAPPAFAFTAPDGGYVFRTDQIGTVVDGQYLMPATGDQPMQFVESPSNCLWLAPNGTHIVHQPFAGTCDATVTVVNPWGSDTRTLHFTFVDPAGTDRLVIPSLTATPIEGAAPLLVHFDGTHTVMPADDGTYAIATFLWSGDGDGVELGVTPDSLVTDYVYQEPGTYEATLDIVLRDDTLNRAAFSSRATVQIIVDAAESRPPATALTVDKNVGPAPLAIHFTSHTVEGDAKIADYAIDFGDGDRFETQFSDFAGFVEPSTAHSYATPGAYTATLTVIDTEGRAATSTQDIVATAAGGSPPIAHIVAFPARGDVPLTVSLAADVSDLDGYVVRSTWILPDGTVTANPQPTFTLTQPGDVTVKLVVADDTGLTSTATAIVSATKDGATPPRVVSTPTTRAIGGQHWQYDADGVMSVVGGGPYAFTLGKKLGDQVVNAPAGMKLDERIGKLTWEVPANVHGEVPVSVVVENAAGTTLHEFVLTVASSDPLRAPPASCASTNAPATFAPLFAFLGVLLLRRKRRE